MQSFPIWQTGIVLAGVLLQGALALILYRRGLVRFYPSFFAYMCLNVVEDPAAIALGHFSRSIYLKYYFSMTVLDYALQFLILWEIARNVFRTGRSSLPFRLDFVAAITVAGAVILIIPVAGVHPTSFSIFQATGSGLAHSLVRVSVVLAILKILLFAALAGFAQVLGIGWRNHVLQLASGFAFFAVISVLVQVSNSHIPGGSAYLLQVAVLNALQAVAYLMTVGFWIWAFSRNDAPRKEFTPQMQEVLVTIAQSAKRTRLAVTRSTERR